MTREIGDVRVPVGVQDNTKRGVQTIEKRFKAMSQRLAKASRQAATAAATIGAPLVLAARQFAKAGDQLHKMSKRTGITVEELSKLKFAAEQSGTDIDQLSQAIFRANRRIGNATTETGPAKRALDELGLSAKELTKLDASTQFNVLVDSLNGVANEARRSQLGFEIFGDNWRQLQPLISSGTGEIKKLKEQAEALGITMSTDMANKAAELNDSFNSLGNQFKAIAVEAGSALAPALTSMANSMIPVVRQVIEWVKANPQLIEQAGKMALALGGLSVATKALSMALSVNPFVLMAGAVAEAVSMIAGLNGELDKTVKKVGSIGVGGSAVSVAAQQAVRQSQIYDSAAGAASGGSGQSGLFTKHGGKIKGLLEQMTGAVKSISEQRKKERADSFAGFTRKLTNDIRLGIESASKKVKQLGGIAGAGVQLAANFGQQQMLPQMAQMTSGSFGSAAGIGSTGGPARAIEDIADLAGQQVDLLDTIKDGITKLKDKQS